MKGSQALGRTEAPPVIPDSEPPIFVTAYQGLKKIFNVEIPASVSLRLGPALPKQTANLRTVTLI
jgi:hypothetical protein